MIYIGIDPGQEGGIAVLDGNTNQVWVYSMPDGPTELANCLFTIKEYQTNGHLAALEAVHAMPKQGVSSAFTFGMGYGMLQGTLAAYKIPFIFVTPQKWQKAVFDSAKRGDTKARSLDLARRLFPQIDLHRKGDHGKSDALLIALWLKKTQEAT